MAEVTLHPPALARFLTNQVQPFLFKKAQEIAQEARNRAPVGQGDLKESINVQRSIRGSVKVRVDSPHAGYVHQGTGPQHQPSPRAPYFPKLRRRGLILWSDSKNLNPYQVAHGISVNGTPANPFLADSIPKVLGRYNFRWIRTELKEV